MKKSHSFLKRVVTLCLIMMSIITVGVLVLAWYSREQLPSSIVATLIGAWCGELLMSLLKRNNDTKKENKKEQFEDSSEFDPDISQDQI